MNIFISYAHRDAEVVRRLTRALQNRHVEVSGPASEIRPGNNLDKRLERSLATADALVFLIRPGGSASRELESQWRSALRIEWDVNGGKAMIPLAIGDANLPPFLRDRRPIHFSESEGDYDAIAEQIIQRASEPVNAIDPERRAAAIIEQESRLSELRRFAETLERTSSRSQ